MCRLPHSIRHSALPWTPNTPSLADSDWFGGQLLHVWRGSRIAAIGSRATNFQEHDMSEDKPELSGPDFTQGVDVATIPDSDMLTDCWSATRFVVRGTTPASPSTPAKLNAHPRCVRYRCGVLSTCAMQRASLPPSNKRPVSFTCMKSWSPRLAATR